VIAILLVTGGIVVLAVLVGLALIGATVLVDRRGQRKAPEAARSDHGR
jgi:hypothetical protein